jgi:acetyl esterase/lipase
MNHWIARLMPGLLALPLAACSNITFLAANVPASLERYEASRDLSYGEDPRQRLDVYRPQGTEQNERAKPVIVFFHGGRWSFGEKEQYKFVGAALAGRGFVAMLPNYRLYPQARLAQFGDDAARAIAWAREHAHEYGGDPRRLFVMGHSAGAHLAALVTLDASWLARHGVASEDLAGAIGLAGPYDFLPFTDEDIRDMFGPEAQYRRSQPIAFARPDAPPLLLMHGLRDDTVWVKNTRNLAAALDAAGARYAVRYYDRLGHGDLVGALSLPLRRRAPVLDDIALFVAERTPVNALRTE